MGRMYGSGKGVSSSALPWKRTAPSWVKTTPEQVVDTIVKLARKGARPSQIGVTLRDLHAVPLVKAVTGNKILRIMRLNKVAPALPEDLYHLIKKAIAIRKHLARFTADGDAKFRLILVESLIHRLARYYKKTRKLDAKWGYSAQTASTLIA